MWGGSRGVRIQVVSFAVAMSLLAACSQSGGDAQTGDVESTTRGDTTPENVTTTVEPTTVESDTTGVTTTTIAAPAPIAESDEMVPADPGSLETAGIQVVDTLDELTSIEAPIVLTRVQENRMLADVGPASGFLGTDIDALVPIAEQVPPLYPIPPMSYWLAAWVSTADTPSAQLARSWMGERDWTEAPQIRFPHAVIMLFVNDLANAIDAAPEPGPYEAVVRFELDPLLPPPTAEVVLPTEGDASASPQGFVMQQTAPCLVVDNFLAAAIGAIINKLRITAIAGLSAIPIAGDLLAPLLNEAAKLGEKALTAFVTDLVAPVYDVLRTGLATLAIATQIASYVNDQRLTITHSPGNPTRFAIGDDDAVRGTFTARAASLTEQWPDFLVKCAAATNITLPTLVTPGAEAEWEVEQAQPLITVKPDVSVMGDDLSTSTDYETGRDPEEYRNGEIVTSLAYITVRVPRREVDQLLQLGRNQAENAKKILLEVFPPGTRNIADAGLSAVLDPVLGLLQSEISKQAGGGIFSVRGKYTVAVDHRLPPETTTTTNPTPPGSGTPKDDFCAQYQAMISNAIDTGGMDIPPWAAEILRRLKAMRPAAPADLVDDVDVLIGNYELIAADADADAIIDYALNHPVAESELTIRTTCGTQIIPTPG